MMSGTKAVAITALFRTNKCQNAVLYNPAAAKEPAASSSNESLETSARAEDVDNSSRHPK